jgi:hypothetical protein
MPAWSCVTLETWRKLLRCASCGQARPFGDQSGSKGKLVTAVVINVTRLTTEYDEREDRIRIAAETKDGAPIVIWMTHRLASRAVPLMLRWLDEEQLPSAGASSERREVLQTFNQEAAVGSLKPQKPVAPNANAAVLLIQAMDVAASRSHLILTFRGQEAQSATVKLDATRLRQWLSILHLAWAKAQWSPLVWPNWIKRENPTQEQVVLH